MFFSALVVNNKDIDKEGKIEVYVPSIQPKQKQMSKDITVLDDEITFEFGNEEMDDLYKIPFSGKIYTKDTILARPDFLTETDHGQFLVPEEGDEVNVYFKNNDFNTCYYGYFGPYKRAKIIEFGEIIEDELNFKDHEQKQNLRVLLLTKSGHIIAFNDTTDRNGVLFKTGNDHRLKMEKNKYFNGIHLNTENNNKIVLDDGNKGIIIETTDHHKLSLDDGADNGIEMKTAKGNILTMSDTERFIKLKSTDNQGLIIDDKNELVGLIHKSGSRIIMNKKGGIDIYAPGDINITSKTHITMQAPRIDLNPGGGGFLGSLASFAMDSLGGGLGGGIMDAVTGAAGGGIMDTLSGIAGDGILDTITNAAGGTIMDTIKETAISTVTDAVGMEPSEIISQVTDTLQGAVSDTMGSKIVDSVKETLGITE